MYQETIDFLYSQLPQYQHQGIKAYKGDLSNILSITNRLGNPHKKFKSIHIAGTNGKGSTSHILASILQEAGYKVGLYTSPHLKDFRERIKISGKKISKKDVISFVNENKDLLTDISPSFFEWSVGLAFHYFAEKKVDIAIIETGLGGRLDSTNIITPEISVITNIGLDHQAILGNTLEKIAQEKAGIIKENVPVVIGETQEEIENVFKTKAKNLNSPIYFADAIEKKHPYKSDLKGGYQVKNINTSLQVIDILIHKNWKILEENITNGLMNVTKNTGLQGRWQIIQENPTVIYDVAHNEAGFNVAIKSLSNYSFSSLSIVLGLSKDKQRDEIYKLLPKNASYYFTTGENPRLLNSLVLKQEALLFYLKGENYDLPIKALSEAIKKANKDDLILVIGSNFMIGELI